MKESTFIEAAIQFSTKHIPVLPVCAIVDGHPLCGNHNCPGNKHPLSALVPHGVKDSTISEATIYSWGAKYPRANIGIATGAVSNLVVLDIDPKNGGDKTFQELIEKHGTLPETPCWFRQLDLAPFDDLIWPHLFSAVLGKNSFIPVVVVAVEMW
jgi:hypothetical protein